VVVATHAPAFLGTPMANAEYIRVRREDGVTRADVIEPRVLSAVESYAATLGLSSPDLLQLTRAALLVEGPQDRQVLEGFFGRETAVHFIRTLPLLGSDNALAILDAELLHQLDIPLFLMLDGTAREQIEALRRGRLTREDFGVAGKEMRKAAALMVALRGSGLTVTQVPLPLPDVVWALPEEAMKRVVPEFTSWDAVTRAFRQERKPTNPKDFLAGLINRRIDSSFIDAVIAVSQELGLPAAPQLTTAVAEIVSTLDSVSNAPDSG
jgi:hypothetical protein